MVLCNNSRVRRIIAAAASAIFAACLFAFFPVKADAASSYKISLEDLDECLTKYEEKELEGIMQETADKIKCNIGFVITSDLEGMSSERHAIHYLSEKFGSGSDSIVLVLLNKHDNPKYSSELDYHDELRMEGHADELFYKYGNDILDKAYRGLDNDFPGSEPEHIKNVYKSTDSIQFFMTGKYYCKALVSYSNPVSRFFSNALEFFVTNPIFGLAVIAIPIVITVCVVSASVSKYKKKKPLSAAEYIDRSHFRMKREVDRFVREYTTSVSIRSSSGGGGRSGGGGGGGGGHSFGGRSR